VKPTYLNSSNVSRLFTPSQAVRTMNMIICEDLTHSHEIGTMREWALRPQMFWRRYQLTHTRISYVAKGIRQPCSIKRPNMWKHKT
jgi:hypothetical protein